jgi:hypothetical protein
MNFVNADETVDETVARTVLLSHPWNNPIVVLEQNVEEREHEYGHANVTVHIKKGHIQL